MRKRWWRRSRRPRTVVEMDDWTYRQFELLGEDEDCGVAELLTRGAVLLRLAFLADGPLVIRRTEEKMGSTGARLRVEKRRVVRQVFEEMGLGGELMIDFLDRLRRRGYEPVMFGGDAVWGQDESPPTPEEIEQLAGRTCKASPAEIGRLLLEVPWRMTHGGEVAPPPANCELAESTRRDVQAAVVDTISELLCYAESVGVSGSETLVEAWELHDA